MLDEFDIESYKLKPINQGLGFHERLQGKSGVRPVSKMAFERRLERKKKMEGNDALKAFYEMPADGIGKTEERVVIEKREAKVKSHVQLAGWLLDLILIGIIGSMAILGLAFFAHFFAGASVEMVVLVFFRIDSMAGGGILFVITYLLYFTYGDIGTSWGKNFLGMKLVVKSGEIPSSKMTLIRSLTTLFSLCLLGIPALFDCQGRLSNTKVIRE